MRMNISVPDALAEEVRRHRIPVSEVAQEALRAAVATSRSARIAALRDGLAEDAESTANWRLNVAQDYPDDERNIRCADTLRALAAYFRAMPDDDPALGDLLALHQPDTDYELMPWHGERWNYVLGRAGFRGPQAPAAVFEDLLRAAAEDLREFQSIVSPRDDDDDE